MLFFHRTHRRSFSHRRRAGVPHMPATERGERRDAVGAALWLVVASLLPAQVWGDGCIDYGDYLHWVGGVKTSTYAQDVAVVGSYAYVADVGLQVFDISNPAMPVIVGGIDTPDLAQGVAVAGSYSSKRKVTI